MRGKNHAVYQAAVRAYRAAFLGAFEKSSTALVDARAFRLDGDASHVTEHFGTIDANGVPALKDRREYGDIVWHSFDTEAAVHARGLKVKRDDMRQDRWGQYLSIFRQHGRLMRTQQKHTLLDAIVAGFTTGRSYDGATHFSTTHVTNSGATWSNRLNLALDEEAFEAGLALLLGAPMPDGDIMAGQFDELSVSLWVGPKNQANARRLVEAQINAAGASNVNFGRASVKLIPEFDPQNPKYAAYDDFWLLLAEPAGAPAPEFRPFTFLEPDMPELIDRMDPADPEVFDDDHYRFGVRGNYGFGNRAPWMTVGSTGEA